MKGISCQELVHGGESHSAALRAGGEWGGAADDLLPSWAAGGERDRQGLQNQRQEPDPERGSDSELLKMQVNYFLSQVAFFS